MERPIESSDKQDGRVAICIASCRRPRGLLALLQSLDALVFTDAAPDLEIHVIDNDPAESAREICEQAGDWLRYPIHYGVEPRAGIPQARNATLDSALDRAEWLVFVDDDETVEPGWLAALLETQRRHQADVVTGPAIPRFIQPAPRWIIEGGFYRASRFADGSERPTAFTHNTLVRSAALRNLESLFDERLPLGEDTELFMRLAARGSRIVWCDRAIAYESIPPERMQVGFILHRGYREGIAIARIATKLDSRGMVQVLARGITRFAQGLVEAFVPWPCGFGARARGLRRAAYGAGLCIGIPIAVTRG